MREIGLETKRSRHVDLLEEGEHRLPRMHARPADLALGGEALAVARGDHRRLAEGRGDLPDRLRRVLRGGLGRRRAVDPDHAVSAHAVLVEDARDAAALPHRVDEARARVGRAHRAVADRARPDRRDERADREVALRDRVGEAAEVRLRRVRVDVRMEEEEVDAVEAAPARARLRGEVEHALERDRRMVGARLLADESGPHGVVQLHRSLLRFARITRGARRRRARGDSSRARSSAGRRAARSSRCW